MVAIQLDMPDEAKALSEDSKRYDLLNKMFQANGEPDNAIEVAEIQSNQSEEHLLLGCEVL